MKRLLVATTVMLCTLIQNNAHAALCPLQNDTTNTLTPAEREAGWKLLFDGKTMHGWRTYQNKPQTSWYVSNGMLGCKYDTTSTYQHADLIADKKYKNFELSLDWKIEPRANSGILYMVNEKYEYPFQSGPEYQLLDDNFYLNDPKEHIHASQKSGANYDMDAPAVNALKPVGEWNHAVIKVNNGHVEHWLNGQKTADYVIGSDNWKAQKEQSKWKDVQGYAADQTGYIDLQDHGGGVSFKNIKIKEL